MAKYGLSFNKEFNRFVFRDQYQHSDTDSSYEMVIEYEGAGEWCYRFLIWEEGEWWEILSTEERDRRYKDIVDHEGSEVADIWYMHNEYHIVRNDHPVFKLQRKWEAMMELGLFCIPPSWDTWQGRPMSQETIDKMADARDKWQQEEAAEMFEAMRDANRAAEMDDNP